MDDKNDFKLNEENGINPADLSGKGDIYFSNGVAPESVSGTTRTAKRKPVKKSSSVRSTYIFFIVVIVVSMALSIYAVFCMNDVLAITKTKSSVTVSLQEEVDSTSDAIDILADKGLIKCKNFCKLFAKYREAYVGGPYQPGVYYLNGKWALKECL